MTYKRLIKANTIEKMHSIEEALNMLAEKKENIFNLEELAREKGFENGKNEGAKQFQSELTDLVFKKIHIDSQMIRTVATEISSSALMLIKELGIEISEERFISLLINKILKKYDINGNIFIYCHETEIDLIKKTTDELRKQSWLNIALLTTNDIEDGSIRLETQIGDLKVSWKDSINTIKKLK